MKGFLIALALTATASAASARTLDIYFIDVEGGQSTLIVTPAGESLLIDTGYPERDGRDADRIMAAMRDAHVTSIDYLLITHMHEDHNGGAAVRSSSGMTYCRRSSFDRRLSDLKLPPGSDRSVTSVQNC